MPRSDVDSDALRERVRALEEALRELTTATAEREFVDAVGDPNGPAFRRMKKAKAHAEALLAEPAPKERGR